MLTSRLKRERGNAVPRALITGITGQDGTYLSRSLLDRGYDVHGVVKPGDQALSADGAILHAADLRDPAALASVIATVRPNEVYNLGGISSVAGSWASPVETAQATGTAVAALLDASWQLHESGHDVTVVQASSAEIFGMAAASPQNESTPISPASPYGAAKAFAHFLVQSFRHRGLRASTAILYNHESPLRPESFVTRKITASAARIAKGEQSVLSLGNLDAERDWGWAPDYVEAMRLIAQHDRADDFVIGTGVSHSVRDFVIAAFAAAGISDWKAHIEVDPAFARAADPSRQLADPRKARSELGWAPTVDFAGLVTRMVQADLSPS